MVKLILLSQMVYILANQRLLKWPGKMKWKTEKQFMETVQNLMNTVLKLLLHFNQATQQLLMLLIPIRSNCLFTSDMDLEY